MITLGSNEDDFVKIQKEFLESTNGSNPTMKSQNVVVTQIQKVINPISAKFYELKKESMSDKSELMLFHGTRGVSPLTVAQEGLDTRVGNGGYFGRGIYGSRSPYYCHQGYKSQIGIRNMLLYVNFLVGAMKKYNDDGHDSNLTRPPPNFDSVTCDVDSQTTTIRTLYDNAQTYVSYIIYYGFKNSGYSMSNDSDDD